MINAGAYTREYYNTHVHKLTVTVYNGVWYCLVDFCDELEESCKKHNIGFDKKSISDYLFKKFKDFNAPCINNCKFDNARTGIYVHPETYTNLDELFEYWSNRLKPVVDEWHYKVKCWNWCDEHHIDKSHLCDLDCFAIYQNHITSLSEFKKFKMGLIKRFKDNADPHTPIKSVNINELYEGILHWLSPLNQP